LAAALRPSRDPNTPRMIMSTVAEDEAQLLFLDSAWNGAYRLHDRRPLADILAEDFTGVAPSGEPVTKAWRAPLAACAAL